VAVGIVLFLFTHLFAGVGEVAVVFRFKEFTVLTSAATFTLNFSLVLSNFSSYITRSSDVYVVPVYFF
jgi:hypothetical protein